MHTGNKIIESLLKKKEHFDSEFRYGRFATELVRKGLAYVVNIYFLFLSLSLSLTIYLCLYIYLNIYSTLPTHLFLSFFLFLSLSIYLCLLFYL